MTHDPNPLVASLAQTDLCRKFSREEIEQFLQYLQRVEVEADECIFKEGSRGDAWYVVLQGEVAVVKHLVHGPPHILAHLGAGECFGEMALVDGSPRLASVEAVIDSVLFKLPSDVFKELVDTSHPLAVRLLHSMAGILSQRQRELTYILMDLIEVDEPESSPDPDTLSAMLRRAVY